MIRCIIVDRAFDPVEALLSIFADLVSPTTRIINPMKKTMVINGQKIVIDRDLKPRHFQRL